MRNNSDAGGWVIALLILVLSCIAYVAKLLDIDFDTAAKLVNNIIIWAIVAGGIGWGALRLGLGLIPASFALGIILATLYAACSPIWQYWASQVFFSPHEFHWYQHTYMHVLNIAGLLVGPMLISFGARYLFGRGY